LSELQLHYQTMCKQVDQLNLLHHSSFSRQLTYRSCITDSLQSRYYRNAKSASALVDPLIARAIEVLHVQLHFWYLLNCGYTTWLNCLPSACLKLQWRPIVDQQWNWSACIHILW